MYSEEAEAREEQEEELEREREDLALELGDTRVRVKKYDRLRKRKEVTKVKDKKLRRHLQKSDWRSEHAAKKAARMELLLPEEPGCLEAEGMEKTYRFRQEDIAESVPLANSQQYFDLKLDTFGPYSIDYSRHGRVLLLGGGRGHVATMDWQQKRLGCEFHVRETIRDVQFLHNEMMFAVAQKRYLYIYDHSGMELHCLKQHSHINALTFLPYHFLLVSANEYGTLRYLDTSIGQTVAEHKTHLGSLKCITQNPHNAVIHLGHNNGTVTLWSPNQHTPLVKLLCHRGPITALAVDGGGWYMLTSGMDSRLKVWDVRNFKMLHSYFTRRPAVSLDISQRGLVGMGRGREVEVWKDALVEKQRAPYMTHQVAGEVSRVRFCPFEDCLGIGHSSGFTSIIVPGAGEANFDALEANPYQTQRQRQETEVKQLLEKVPAELITLDPTQVSQLDSEQTAEEREEEQQQRGVGGGKRKGRVVGPKEARRKQQAREEARRALHRTRETRKTEEIKKHKSNSHVLDRFR